MRALCRDRAPAVEYRLGLAPQCFALIWLAAIGTIADVSALADPLLSSPWPRRATSGAEPSARRAAPQSVKATRMVGTPSYQGSTPRDHRWYSSQLSIGSSAITATARNAGARGRLQQRSAPASPRTTRLSRFGMRRKLGRCSSRISSNGWANSQSFGIGTGKLDLSAPLNRDEVTEGVEVQREIAADADGERSADRDQAANRRSLEEGDVHKAMRRPRIGSRRPALPAEAPRCAAPPSRCGIAIWSEPVRARASAAWATKNDGREPRPAEQANTVPRPARTLPLENESERDNREQPREGGLQPGCKQAPGVGEHVDEPCRDEPEADGAVSAAERAVCGNGGRDHRKHLDDHLKDGEGGEL